jgi:hypothetical protein
MNGLYKKALLPLRSGNHRDHFYWSKTLASRPFSLKTPPQQATFYILSLVSTVYGIKNVEKEICFNY